jgi:hypothetical protein
VELVERKSRKTTDVAVKDAVEKLAAIIAEQ